MSNQPNAISKADQQARRKIIALLGGKAFKAMTHTTNFKTITGGVAMALPVELTSPRASRMTITTEEGRYTLTTFLDLGNQPIEVRRFTVGEVAIREAFRCATSLDTHY